MVYVDESAPGSLEELSQVVVQLRGQLAEATTQLEENARWIKGLRKNVNKLIEKEKGRKEKPPEIPPEGVYWISAREAAHRLGIEMNTLCRWRNPGKDRHGRLRQCLIPQWAFRQFNKRVFKYDERWITRSLETGYFN